MDFENGFGSVYKKDFSGPQNTYFINEFRKYVNQKILTDHYADNIEQYGIFDGIYRKLSEQIQIALDTTDFFENYTAEQIYPVIHYSKRKEGEIMLESIDPELVYKHSLSFFREGYLMLKNI